MKMLFIRMLIWLVDIPETRVDEIIIRNWQANTWSDPGFQAYARERQQTFLKLLSSGAGLEPLPRDNYAIKFGQRVEALLLIAKCKKAFQEAQDKKKKLKTK